MWEVAVRDLSEGKSMFKWAKPATHSHRIACGISSLVGQNFWRRLHVTKLTALLDIARAFRIFCYSQLLKTTCFFVLFKPNFFSPCGIPPWSKPLFLVGEIPVAWCPWWTRTCFTISLANGDAMEFLIACRGGIAAAGSAPAVKNLWLGAVSWPTITDTSQIFCKSEERNSHPPGWHLLPGNFGFWKPTELVGSLCWISGPKLAHFAMPEVPEAACGAVDASLFFPRSSFSVHAEIF